MANNENPCLMEAMTSAPYIPGFSRPDLPAQKKEDEWIPHRHRRNQPPKLKPVPSLMAIKQLENDMERDPIVQKSPSEQERLRLREIRMHHNPHITEAQEMEEELLMTSFGRELVRLPLFPDYDAITDDTIEKCSNCGEVVETEVHHKVTALTHNAAIFFGIITIFSCCLGCLYPYFGTKQFKEEVHVCPYCGSIIKQGYTQLHANSSQDQRNSQQFQDFELTADNDHSTNKTQAFT